MSAEAPFVLLTQSQQRLWIVELRKIQKQNSKTKFETPQSG